MLDDRGAAVKGSRLKVDIVRNAYTVMSKDVGSFTNDSCRPSDDDVGVAGVVLFEPHGKVFGFDLIKGISAVARVGSGEPFGRMVPCHQFLIDLGHLHAVGHPAQP